MSGHDRVTPSSDQEREKPSLLVQLFRPLMQRIGLWNLVVLALALAILGSVASGIAGVVRGLEFPLLWLVGILALFFGWFLGLSKLKPWLSGVVAVFSGILLVFVRVGRLDLLAWALLQRLGPYLVDSARALWSNFTLQAPTWLGLTPVGRPAPDPGLLAQSAGDLSAATITLFTRAAQWLGAFFRGEPTYDPVAATLIWGVLLWLASLWAGWVLRRRRQALAAIAPLGVLLATVLSYAWGQIASLVFLMGWALILMAVMAHRNRESHWELVDIDFSRDIRVEVLGVAALITVGLVLLAFIVPSVSIEKIVEQVRELTQKQSEDTGAVAESLGVEQRPRPNRAPELARASAGGLPRRHLLGTGPELRENLVMEIRTFELPQMQTLPPDVVAIPYYWRSITYDVYNGQGWNTSAYAVVDYEPGATSYIELPYHRVLRQHVRVLRDVGSLVHTAGQMVAVDQAYQVAWRVSGDPFAATTVGETYRADSLVPMVSAEQLREVYPSYPPWIMERYLTLPDSLPDRVLGLARDLTATAPTPYDRAVAIETYLRSTYPYTLNVPLPAAGADVVDYFLFVAKRGYCDYFASSMVVLARAAGLPARLAVGYAPGTYDPFQAAYFVTEADAHAWVEVYFTGYGWIPFEPTSGRTSLERSAQPEPSEWPALEESLRPPPSPLQRALARWYWGIPVLLVGAVLGVIIASQVELLVLRLQSPANAVTALYHRLRRRASKLGIGELSGDTPYQFLARMEIRLPELAEGKKAATWMLPAAIEQLRSLIMLYVREWYTASPLGSAEHQEALRAWRGLFWRLLLARWWARRRSYLERLLRGEGEVSLSDVRRPSPMDQRY
ncbi:MAG: transglutaminase domain-containing protein [Anaerolineae bacterium]|jgi:transglutaminase-like putative cysteine protease|nr:transglutaminase domain-containing protein [Anaerolineae bacterium]